MKSLSRTLFYVLAGIVFIWYALVAVVFAITSVQTIFFPFALEQNEGVVLYITQLIQQGRLPYLPLTQPPYFINNYPPVYPLFSAMTGYLFSYPLASGRLISTLALAGIAVVSGLIIYRMVKSYLWSMICGAFFMALPMIAWQCRYYRVDALGAFFNICAVYSILCADKKRVPVILSALFCILALYTKHSMLAAPLAIIIVLFLYRHQYKWFFLAAFLSALIIPAAILQAISHGEFLKHLFVYTVTGFTTPDVKRHVLPLLSLLVWWAGTVIFCVTHRTKEAWTMKTAVIFLYGILSLNGIALIFKEGASNLYLIEVIAASIIMGGYAWYSIINTTTRRNGITCAVIAIVLLSNIVPWFTGSSPYYRIAMGYTRFLSAIYAREREIYLRVKSAPGRVLCENIIYPVLCGKHPEWVAFMTKQLHKRGINSDEKIRALIQSKAFSLIVLENPLTVKNNKVVLSAVQLSQLTPGIMEDILQHYYMRPGETYFPQQPNRYVKQKTILYPR